MFFGGVPRGGMREVDVVEPDLLVRLGVLADGWDGGGDALEAVVVRVPCPGAAQRPRGLLDGPGVRGAVRRLPRRRCGGESYHRLVVEYLSHSQESFGMKWNGMK